MDIVCKRSKMLTCPHPCAASDFPSCWQGWGDISSLSKLSQNHTNGMDRRSGRQTLGKGLKMVDRRDSLDTKLSNQLPSSSPFLKLVLKRWVTISIAGDRRSPCRRERNKRNLCDTDAFQAEAQRTDSMAPARRRGHQESCLQELDMDSSTT